MRKSHVRRAKSQKRFETRDERAVKQRSSEARAAERRREKYAKCPNSGAIVPCTVTLSYSFKDAAQDYPLFVKAIESNDYVIGYSLDCPHCEEEWMSSTSDVLTHP